ncbi:hypothetical protein HK102_000552 [Quaeritorhiza haematococci]|nr:hypothetical protein HK102_000552 [Quaeritorhiza haematococci]
MAPPPASPSPARTPFSTLPTHLNQLQPSTSSRSSIRITSNHETPLNNNNKHSNNQFFSTVQPPQPDLPAKLTRCSSSVIVTASNPWTAKTAATTSRDHAQNNNDVPAAASMTPHAHSSAMSIFATPRSGEGADQCVAAAASSSSSSCRMGLDGDEMVVDADATAKGVLGAGQAGKSYKLEIARVDLPVSPLSTSPCNQFVRINGGTSAKTGAHGISGINMNDATTVVAGLLGAKSGGVAAMGAVMGLGSGVSAARAHGDGVMAGLSTRRGSASDDAILPHLAHRDTCNAEPSSSKKPFTRPRPTSQQNSLFGLTAAFPQPSITNRLLKPYWAINARELLSAPGRRAGCGHPTPFRSTLREYIKGFTSTEFDVYTMDEEEIATPPFACDFAHYENNGKYLAISDEDGNIKILDTRYDNRSDDKHLAACLWDVKTMTCKHRFMGHNSSVKAVTYNPHDPNIFATAAREGTIMIWDIRCTGGQVLLDNGEYINRPANIIRNAHESQMYNVTQPKKRRRRASSPSARAPTSKAQSVTSVCYLLHEKNTLASTGAADGLIKYWDLRSHGSHMSKSRPQPVESSLVLDRWKRPHGLVTMSLAANGSRIYVACTDNSVYEYNVRHLQEPLNRFTAKDFYCGSFFIKTTCSPDGRFVASGSMDGGIYVWEVDDPTKPPIMLKGHRGDITGLSWCRRDLDELASCSDDNKIRIWRIKDRHSAGAASNGDDGTGHGGIHIHRGYVKECELPSVESSALSTGGRKPRSRTNEAHHRSGESQNSRNGTINFFNKENRSPFVAADSSANSMMSGLVSSPPSVTSSSAQKSAMPASVAKTPTSTVLSCDAEAVSASKRPVSVSAVSPLGRGRVPLGSANLISPLSSSSSSSTMPVMMENAIIVPASSTLPSGSASTPSSSSGSILTDGTEKINSRHLGNCLANKNGVGFSQPSDIIIADNSDACDGSRIETAKPIGVVHANSNNENKIVGSRSGSSTGPGSGKTKRKRDAADSAKDKENGGGGLAVRTIKDYFS